MHPERRHTLKQEHGVGHRDFQIRLLHAVAEAGVEDLDFSRRRHDRWILKNRPKIRRAFKQ
jgi:hypothetical protein